jgi:methylated-DNA-[protein]-cysteine S-methyltransferase
VPGTPPEHLFLDRFVTPIGKALIVTDGDGLVRAVDWEDHADRMRRLLDLRWGQSVTLTSGKTPEPVRSAFERYFGGEIGALDGLARRTTGTAFQQKVWTALGAIPA